MSAEDDDFDVEHEHMGKVMEKLSDEANEEEASAEAIATDGETHPCSRCGNPLKNDGEKCRKMVPDPENPHDLKMCDGRRAWSGKTLSWEGTLAEKWIHKNGDAKWRCKVCGILNDNDASKCPACDAPAQEEQAPAVEEVLPPQVATDDNEASTGVPAAAAPATSNPFQNWSFGQQSASQVPAGSTFQFSVPTAPPETSFDFTAGPTTPPGSIIVKSGTQFGSITSGGFVFGGGVAAANAFSSGGAGRPLHFEPSDESGPDPQGGDNETHPMEWDNGAGDNANNVHEDSEEAALENAPELPTLDTDMPSDSPPGTAIDSFSELQTNEVVYVQIGSL